MGGVGCAGYFFRGEVENFVAQLICAAVEFHKFAANLKFVAETDWVFIMCLHRQDWGDYPTVFDLVKGAAELIHKIDPCFLKPADVI